jgi:hypothetical protein
MPDILTEVASGKLLFYFPEATSAMSNFLPTRDLVRE